MQKDRQNLSEYIAMILTHSSDTLSVNGVVTFSHNHKVELLLSNAFNEVSLSNLCNYMNEMALGDIKVQTPSHYYPSLRGYSYKVNGEKQPLYPEAKDLNNLSIILSSNTVPPVAMMKQFNIANEGIKIYSARDVKFGSDNKSQRSEPCVLKFK